MKKPLHIAIHYESNRKEQLLTFLKSISREHKLDWKVNCVERYDKFNNQFRAQVSLLCPYEHNKDVVFFMLQLTNLFKQSPKGEITVSGPYLEDEHLSFETILTQEVNNMPVKWVHIQIDS